jgi:hypothetical protein
MSAVDDFNSLLADFNKIEERMFLRKINDFAETHKEIVVKTYALILGEDKMNIQLKYLVLKSISELKYREFVPIIQDLLKREDKVQIIYEAVNSLVRINTLSAYKAIILYLKVKAGEDFIANVEERLKEFFERNKLIYHFDVFYRDRGDIRGVEKSSEFLIKHLPEEYIKDIIPALNSHFYRIRYELLRILKQKPNCLYYPAVYNYFKANADSADEPLFLLLSETLVINASLSKMASKIFSTLKQHLDELGSEKRKIFSITLLKLNTSAMIREITAIYPQLGYEWKLLVFENLKREEYGCYLNFVQGLFVTENSEELLSKIISILIYARDYGYIFDVLKAERMPRKELLLGIIMDFDPPDIHYFVKDYVDGSQSDKVLSLSLEYLLRHAADEYFDLAGSVFFSNVDYHVKILIIRHLAKFSPFNRKIFMEAVFKDISVVDRFKKDFLFSLLGVMNEKTFEREFEELILSRVLILMEESGIDDIVNFIYFFDKYVVENINDMGLIIDECRMIQNTILKSGGNDDLVRMIHILIKNIEKKMRGKKP